MEILYYLFCDEDSEEKIYEIGYDKLSESDIDYEIFVLAVGDKKSVIDGMYKAIEWTNYIMLSTEEYEQIEKVYVIEAEDGEDFQEYVYRATGKKVPAGEPVGTEPIDATEDDSLDLFPHIKW